jgi:hypothetical protein
MDFLFANGSSYGWLPPDATGRTYEPPLLYKYMNPIPSAL